MTKPLPTFSVEARVTLITSVDITATDFADALERAKSLGVTDFIKIYGAHNDSTFAVIGVSATDGWRLDR